MKKRLLALLLVLVMVLGMFPVSAVASTPTAGTVYISASKDGVYLDKMAYAAVSLSDLAKIKLSDYNLSEYADQDKDGVEEITMLHLFIYAQEKIYGGSWKNVVISGAAGSMFVSNGLFGFDQNLNYYHNGKYPVQEDSTVGATADQLVLKDGDFVDVVSYTSYAFYNDPVSGFHYFTNTAGEITHAYEAAVDEPLTVTLMRAGKDITDEESGDTIMAPVDPSKYVDAEGNSRPIYYGASAFATDASSAALNESGEATVTFSEAGTYYLWAYGGYGSMEPGEWDDGTKIYVVSSPAYAVVTVASGEEEPDDGAWDGETKTEPQTDSDGVYQIGTGAELAWFVAKSETLKSSKYSISGKLTADIDLGGKAWVASTTSGNGQTINLDGDGHKVTGLNSTLGLFGVVSNAASVVKNLSVYGEVNGAEGQYKVGGIAAYFNGTMENCVNYATVTGSDNSGKSWIGGLAGYVANANTKFINCANYGTVTASGDYVGGLVGNLSVGGTITGSYNVAAISGSSYVGGLVGGQQNSGKITVTGSYSTGTVTGSNYVGGLFGYATGKNSKDPSLVSHCYSSGTITGSNNTKPLFGKAVTADKPLVSASNCFYLSTTGTDSYGTGLTEAQLKSAIDLSVDYFRSVCGSYPAVLWQKDVTAHTANGAGTVTAPACEAVGFTTYTCQTCGLSYKADVVAATGHAYCTHDVDTTCEHCSVTKDPTVSETGVLSRTCQNGCGVAKEDTIPALTSHTITLPENPVGYTVTACEGSSSPVAENGSYSFTVTIAKDYKASDDFKVLANDTEITAVDKVYTIANITANQTITVEGVVEKTSGEKGFTVIAPAGSTITAGRFHDYYQYDFATPVETGTTDDGNVYAVFEAGRYLQSFYRVQHPDGVTYWEFANTGSQVFSAGEVYTVTAEALHLNSEDFTKSTTYTDYSQNAHDKADIYLNINEKGYINLDVGATKELNVFRNWMSLDNTTMNTGAALPDVTYTVLTQEGTDVIEITPDTNNSCVATLTAKSEGTAIVLVTYDAMTNLHADGGSRFSAIWPENTGVFVVSVGKDGSAIATNMTIHETINGSKKQALDAEHDIFFYAGNAGASYSFKPEEGCEVYVAHGSVSEGKLTFGNFVKTGVTTATDGTVTLTGLTTGVHVVKVEKGGVATYQVIRARQVSYTLTGEDGVAISEENPAQPGETVSVQFSGLISPMEKLSGVYNARYGFYYNGEKGVEIRTRTTGYGDYYYSSSSSRTPFTVTIPENWNSESYTLTDGTIQLGGYGSFAGEHRTVTYKDGKAPNTNAADVDGVLSVLPDVVIPTVYDDSKLTVTLPTGEGFVVSGEDIANPGEDYSFTVTVKGGYDGSAMVVKANGMTLTAQADGSYKVENLTSALSITVEGVVKLTNTFTDSGTKVYEYDFHEPSGATDTDYGWFTNLMNYLNVKDLTLFGASVEEISWNEDKSVCQVTLAKGTASDAVIGFAITYGANEMFESFLPYCTATLNGSAMTEGAAMAVRLANGSASVSICAGTDLTNAGDTVYSYTKTFQISVAEGEPEPQPEKHTVSFQVKKDSTFNSYVGFLKLYSWNGTEKGTELSLGEKVDGLYTVELEEGTYWVEGYDCKETQERLGGMTLTVTEDASYTIKHGAKIAVTNSGWVYGTDYTAAVTLSGPGGENRTTELGTREAAFEGITCIYADGDTITATFTALREDFVGDPAVYTVTPSANVSYQNRIQTKFVPKHTIKVTAPEGSVITGGYLRDYNIYEFVDPVETTSTTASFSLSEASGGNIYASGGMTTHFVRVQHPDGVTYWMFGQWNTETEMTVSEDDLHLNDTVTSSTVVRDFSNNALDLANIYLNINEKGFLTMEAGKTKELNVWRTWQPIESINNAEIALPDVHYTILKTDGTVDTSNSVVSITPDANNSAQATLKAEGAGTAIVLVTYDAVTHDNAMIDPQGNRAQTTFSAIWPENTGVFVVTVGEGLDLSMTMDRPSTDQTTSLDGELDMLYYVGEAGASYTFAPGSGAEVKVARSTVTDGKLTFSGFTAQGVSSDESGNVTVSGLTTGRHIIQVTKDGKTAYQVIAARQTTVTVTHADGTEVTAENPALPGETVTVQLTNLINPVEKSAGIYNNTTYLYYEAADGKSYVSGSGAFGGTYNFNSDATQQRISITIPRYYEGTSYDLVGSMTTGGYGEAPGGHRGYRYGTKGNNNQYRPSTGGDLCALPQLSIATRSVSYVNCTIVLKDGEQTLPLTGRTVKIYDVDGTEQTMGENGAIALPVGEYTYEVSGTGIRYTSGSFTVTAETSEIVLAVVQTPATAWDGTTETEPARDSDGVYQISNGAELAWFVKNVAAATENLSGVLTADIDLADYPWTYANTGWSDPAVYTKLDGQKHTVSGLRGKVSFLSKLGSGSEIKDLTVEGALSGAGNMGGIATSATGTVLENCISRVEITVTGGNVGGLVNTAKDVTIRSCANEGNITASGNYLGGLVASGNMNGYVVVENSRNDGNITASGGSSYAGGILAALNGAQTDSRITGCVNTGSVYTGNYAGGIVGYVTSKMVLTDCYNTGAITAKAQNYSGGIAGDFGGYYNWFTGADPDAAAQMTNCYSIDANASKAIVGNVWQPDTVTFTNCVYLEGLNGDPNGTALSAAQLKAYAPEGSLFVEVCGGYPALSWETGKQAHAFCNHPVTETCEHCEYDPAPAADAVGTLKRHCQNEGCDAIKTEEVPKLNTYTVTLPTGTGFTAAAVEGSASPVVEGGSYSFTVTIADGYEKGEGFAVKANGTALTEADGIYTVSNIRANVTITVEGVEEITTTATWQEILANAQTYLLYQGNQKTPEVGSQNGEWQVLGLARNDAKADFYDAYYENVVQYVKANINEEGKLNSKMSTDNSRVILALSALGKDVTNVGGYDLIKGLSNIRYLTSQGINGPVFALIALDSGDYAEPSEDLRATIIEYLLSKQLSGGGWGLESKPDDMTPMTIQALAPYYDTNDDVKAAVDKALDVMKGMVATTDNAETLAQMVVALSALKKDCETTEGFEDVLDKLLSFAVTDGQKGFRHVSGGNTNQMATEQSFYALVAYSRMKQGKTRLYDMTDVITKQTKYSITIEDAAHGTVTASAEQAVAGTTITLTVEPETGFQLEKLTVTQEGGKAVAVTDNTFVMPEGSVTVKATFVQSENPAQDVMDAINALDVTKADAKTQKQLEAVENAYDNLSEEDQKNVTNHDRLLSMRKKFNKLLEEAKDDARDEVEQIVEKLDKKDYTEDNWDAILELVETTNKKIDEAENTDELQTLLLYFQWELEEVPSGDKITVTFRLIGDSLHDEASKHEEYVTWIPTTTYTMEPGSTMYDVFVQAIADNGMSQQGAANNYVSTIKAPSVLGGYWLGEFDNGRNSGWMYTVNGAHPSVGLCEYDLQDGDRIVWHYVDDYTVEEHKFTWLEAEDISPEEYVKKNGKEEADVDSFTDVNKTDWFYDDVKYVVENGLMNGTGDGKFSPTDSMNRAMLVTVLYRLEGEPKVSGTSEFTDVENNQWYTNAVLWATKNEIVNGYGDGKFGPTDSITREQMATILFRYAAYKNYKTSDSNSLTGYTDFSEISVYALKSLKWANAEGLITGRTASTLAPQGTATRAEVAAILHRFVENVVKG